MTELRVETGVKEVDDDMNLTFRAIKIKKIIQSSTLSPLCYFDACTL